MLYPTLESSHYIELSNYRELLRDVPGLHNEYNVSVVSHDKVKTPSETFIEYTLITERFDERFTVRRRYSDFEWLMDYLYQKYPFHILPPMPPKRFISTIDKFARSFIDKRQAALNVMVGRVCYFHECIADVRTQIFLKQDQKEFDQYKLRHKNSSIFNKFRLSVKQFYGGTLLSIGGVESWKDETTVHYMNILKERSLDRSIMISLLESIDWLFETWEEYSFALLWLAQDLADFVLMMDQSELVVFVDGAAQLFFNLSTEGKIHFNFIAATIQPVFKEYVSYNNSITRTIKQRNQTKAIFHSKTKSLRLLEVKNHPNNIEDIPKGDRIDELTKDSIILEDNLKQFDLVFQPGLTTWQNQRSKDIARCLNTIVTSKLRYHRSCLDLCTHVLKKIQTESPF